MFNYHRFLFLLQLVLVGGLLVIATRIPLAVDKVYADAQARLNVEYKAARIKAAEEANKAAVTILQKATEAGVVVELRLRPQ